MIDMDLLRNFIPKLLWETKNHPEGYIVTSEDFNELWNLNMEQGDYNSKVLESLLKLIFEEGMEGTTIYDLIQDLYDLIAGIENLGAVTAMDFYTNGFKVTYSMNNYQKEFEYKVDEAGNINEIYDVIKDRSVVVNWHNTAK